MTRRQRSHLKHRKKSRTVSSYRDNIFIHDTPEAARGGLTYTETCSCGAVRHIHSNKGPDAVGNWSLL